MQDRLKDECLLRRGNRESRIEQLDLQSPKTHSAVNRECPENFTVSVLPISVPLNRCAPRSCSGRTPAPARYSADSEIPSMPSAFSTIESANAKVQNGASPSQVAVRQNVWQRCPDSSSMALYARG